MRAHRIEAVASNTEISRATKRTCVSKASRLLIAAVSDLREDAMERDGGMRHEDRSAERLGVLQVRRGVDDVKHASKAGAQFTGPQRTGAVVARNAVA